MGAEHGNAHGTWRSPGYGSHFGIAMNNITINKKVTIVYTNWKGETGVRSITPKVFFWGSTQYHPELQWLVTAYDEDKQEDRTFALKDVLNWKPA